MKSQALGKFVRENLPDAPGVYFFIQKKAHKSGQKTGGKAGRLPAAKNRILYIGRATSLRDRVGSYFKDDLMDARGPLLVDMVNRADAIDWRQTDSVLEAIILESNLIKRHQPKHNTMLKDDRSYNYVIITGEDFPRVILMRGRELEKIAEMEADGSESGLKIKKKFGPYPQGGLLREALSIIRKIFPFRDGDPAGSSRGQGGGIRQGNAGRSGISHIEAFYQSIGLSPDTSSPEAKKEYAKTIRNLTLFFEGKKKSLVKALEREMKAYAKTRQFEKAGKAKQTLYALGHIQDVSLIKKNLAEETAKTAGSSDISYAQDDGIFRIEAYDIAHLGGSENVGVMTVVENGEPNKSEYRKFKISRDMNDDVGSLSELLRRRMNHAEWRIPDLIVVDGGQAQINAAGKILAERRFSAAGSAGPDASAFPDIPIVSVVKDDRHKARDILKGEMFVKHRSSILLANAEAHRFAIAFHRRRRAGKMFGAIGGRVKK